MEVHEKLAIHYEDEGQFAQAEENFIKANKHREAVLMHVHNKGIFKLFCALGVYKSRHEGVGVEKISGLSFFDITETILDSSAGFSKQIPTS